MKYAGIFFDHKKNYHYFSYFLFSNQAEKQVLGKIWQNWSRLDLSVS